MAVLEKLEDCQYGSLLKARQEACQGALQIRNQVSCISRIASVLNSRP
jgi:hypothetical protein